jgi:hypothetical protein
MDELYIEIDKENTSKWEYKSRKRNTNPPLTPIRIVDQHGQALYDELSSAVSTIVDVRKSAGVSTDNLLIIELSGQANAKQPDADMLQVKMSLSIIEEVKFDGGKAKLIVQFENKDAIDEFKQEMTLYINGSTETTSRLTAIQRNELFSCIDGIRKISPEDRTGKRLNEAIVQNKLPDGLFTIDIDVWFDGDISKRNEIQGRIKQALGTTGSSLCGDLFVLPNLLLGRAKVNSFTLEALRNLDYIAQVDFPIGTLTTEQYALYATDFVPVFENTLDENAPLACIIDSGVFSGNPLLSNIVVGEEDFDLTEDTVSDLNGHGTAVAGIVAYGDLCDFDKANKVFRPLVRICNGKVMHDTGMDGVDYNDDKRPEQIVSDAIHYFNSEYNCRIFNLSSGNPDHIYNGGRQMAWASMLDDISKKLDVIIVVSTGNVLFPNVPLFSNREDLMRKTRDQLLCDEHRLIDPATAALGVTVGSISRYGDADSPSSSLPVPLSAGNEGYPSAFTRTGEGVNGAIKPDFVDYGGNLAIRQLTSSDTRWGQNRALNEPTLNNTINGVFKGWYGTSFAAPHVTHIAARLQRALYTQLGVEPSANLIRALLASSSTYIQREWLDDVVPAGYTGKNRKTQEWRLRLCGYGKVDDSILSTGSNHVTLIAEDALDLKRIHLYKIPVPEEFLGVKSKKRIAIGFAYNPPTRLSRQAYLANSLWFEVFKRVDEEFLRSFIAKKAEGKEEMAKEVAKVFRQKHDAGFKPGVSSLSASTLQQRIWETGKAGGRALDWDGKYIYVLVSGKAQFNHPDEQIPQSYALAITFSYESKEDIQLRQMISEKVKVKQREQVKIRTQVQI